MIKDVFKFKKNAWHAKLMKRVWGYDPEDFRNMCPYFWLSVVNVVCLPLILVIAGFIVLILAIKKLTEASQASIDRACETKIVKWAAKKTENWWKDEDLIMAVGKNLHTSPWFSLPEFDSYKQKDAKYRKFYEALSPEDKKKLWDKYDARIKEIKEAQHKAEVERWERERVEAEKKRLRDATRAVRIGKATVVIKTIFKIIIWPILLFIAYLLYLIGVEVVSWDYSWVGPFFYFLYLAIGTILGVGLFLYSLFVFSSWISCKLQGVCIPCEARRKAIVKFFKFCFGWIKYFSIVKWPFIWIGRFFHSIWKGIVFLWDIMIAFKQNNCPAIEWED